MKINYDDSKDLLSIQLSESPVAGNVSDGPNLKLGYAADGRLVEIIVVDASKLLPRKIEEDERTIVLTERESRWLAEIMERPPQRTERFLEAMARYQEMRKEAEREKESSDRRVADDSGSREQER
jgi:hypothetical protein